MNIWPKEATHHAPYGTRLINEPLHTLYIPPEGLDFTPVHVHAGFVIVRFFQNNSPTSLGLISVPSFVENYGRREETPTT